MRVPKSQNQFLFSRQRKMLDVCVSRAHIAPASKSARGEGAVSDGRIVAIVSQKRGLDGIQREEQDILKRLQSRSIGETLWRFFRKGELYFRFVKRTLARFVPNIAPNKMLYGSLIGGVAFGIVSMGFIEHFFGPSVFARSSNTEALSVSERTQAVMGISTDKESGVPQTDYDSQTDVFFEYFSEAADEKYKESVREMVKGYPIEEMLPYILDQDRLTAAFLIGIAKKESNWGKRVPVLDEQDCFNYWGYRGIRRLMGTGGHTCFNSRKDAVETVAKRLNTLIHSEELNTPEKMVVWKCGFSCSGHSRESVKKWISDVDMYFSRVTE